ncbi:hypothetical protein [Yoonia sp. 2307UL14-13]|uniref:hypothetical protein n=1 Tax=Yoonia sp. 2307UL14-13 TaxID=3126506 RepID=UPI0030A6C9F0
MMTFLTSPTFLSFSFVVALLGFALAMLADHLQILAKYNGAVNKRVAGGYNLAMKVMVANRVGAVLYFLLMAFNVDNGLSAHTLAVGLAVTVGCIAVPTVGLMIWLQKQLKAQGSALSVLDVSHWPKAIVIATFCATSLNILGLTLPWIAGATYPELRLTLVNTSFLFNTFFTVINVFYIEHHFARLVDREAHQIHGFVAGVMAARFASFFIVSMGLWIAL